MHESHTVHQGPLAPTDVVPYQAVTGRWQSSGTTPSNQAGPYGQGPYACSSSTSSNALCDAQAWPEATWDLYGIYMGSIRDLYGRLFGDISSLWHATAAAPHLSCPCCLGGQRLPPRVGRPGWTARRSRSVSGRRPPRCQRWSPPRRRGPCAGRPARSCGSTMAAGGSTCRAALLYTIVVHLGVAAALHWRRWFCMQEPVPACSGEHLAWHAPQHGLMGS